MLVRERAALVVIDFQDGLLPKILGRGDIVARAVKLIKFARELDIPIVWSEQYPKGLGSTTQPVAQELEGCTPLEKVSFGCFGEPSFVEALDAAARGQLLVTGIEAHVCVMQTVLAALEAGYEVFVARDAVGSRGQADCEAGLERMKANGAEIVTVEMAMFEILGKAGTPEFKRVLPLIK